MATTLDNLGATITDGQPAIQSPLNAPPRVPDYGENPWITQQREADQADTDFRLAAQAKIDSVALDPDSYFKGKDLGFTSDPKKAQAMAVNSAFMEFASGDMPVPLGESDINRRLIRQDLAMRMFDGRGADSEEAFYGEIVRDANDRKVTTEFFNELSGEAVKAATVGAVGESATSFQAWREQAKTKPGYKPGNDADYLEAWNEARQASKDLIEPYRDELSQVFQGWKESTGAGKATGIMKGILSDLLPDGGLNEGADSETVKAVAQKSTRQTAWEVYDKLSAEERPKFMQALGIAAANVPKEERPKFFANIAKQSGRDLESLAQGAVTGAVSLGQSGGTVGWEDFIGSNEALAARNEKEAETREKFRRQSDFVQEVQKMQEGTYDPLKYLGEEGSWQRRGEKIAYGTAGVLATAIAASNPYTAPALFSSVTESHYQAIKDSQMKQGASYEDASRFATEAAPYGAAVETLSEFLGSKLLRGKLPFADKMLTGLMDKISNTALRAGVRVAAGGVEQGMQEVAQNYIGPAMEELGHYMGNAKYGAGKVSFAENVDSFASVFPLALMGIPGAFGREARINAFIEAKDLQILAAGGRAADVAKFRQDAAKGKESASVSIDAMVANFDPSSDSAKEASAQLVEEMKLQRAAVEAAQLSGIIPKFVPTVEGIRVIDSETGNELGLAKDGRDAVRIASIHSEMVSEENENQVAFLSTLIDAAALKTDDQNFQQLDPFKKLTATEAAQISKVDEARVLSQQKFREMMTGEDGTADVVFGRSSTEFKQRSRETTNRIYAGGSVLTVFHEDAHGFFREALDTKRLTIDGTIDAIHGIQSGMDAKTHFLPSREALAAMSEKDRNEAVDEAVSEVVEALVLKNRRDGKIPPGIVSRNLMALAKISKNGRTFKGFADNLRAYFGVVFARVIQLRKGIRDGTVKESDIEAFTNKLFGLDAQDEHDTAAMAARDEILGGDPFSLGKDRSTMDADYTNSPGGANIGDRAQPGNSAVFETDSDAIEAGFSEGPYFHGTPEGGFSEFDETKTSRPQKLEKGAYFFTDSEDAAEQYSQDGTNPEILRVRLKIKKPLILGRDVLKALEDGDASKNFDTWEEQIAAMEKEGLAFRDGNELYIASNYNQELIDYANEHGFDSFRTIDDAVDSVGNRILSWAVLDPSQIAIIDPARFNQSTPADSGAYSLGPARMADALADEAISRIKNPQARMVVMRALANKIATAKADLIAISEGRPPSYRERQTKESFDGAQHEQSMIALEDERQAAEDDFDQAVADLKAEEQGAIQDARADVLSKLGPNNGQNQAGKVAYNEAVRQAVAKVREAQKTKREKLRKEHTATVAKLDAKEKALAKRAAVSDTKAKGDRRRNAEVATVRQEMAFAKEQQRRDILTSLAMFDGILSVLPTHLRGKVGGYTTLASLTTDEARLKYLQTRVAKIDDVVQSFLKKEYSKMLEKIIERSKPKNDGKGGKKRTGKLGHKTHDFFAKVELAMKLTDAEVNAAAVKLDNKLANKDESGNDLDPLSEEEQADLFEEWQILNMFGSFDKNTLLEKSDAVTLAQDVYEAGRNQWRMKEEARLADVKAGISDAKEEVGNGDAIDLQNSKAKQRGFLDSAVDMRWSGRSMREVIESFFGKDSKTAKRFVRPLRKAFQARTAEMIRLEKAWSKQIEVATGKTGRAARLQVFEMQTKQTIRLLVKPEFTETIKIPIATFFDSEKPSSLGLSKLEIAQLTEQFEGLSDKSNVKYLALKRALTGDKYNGRMMGMTQAEGIHISMLWAQEGYKKGLTKHGYGEDFQKELESKLSPAAKALREFLADYYRDSFPDTAKLYREMFGVNLRQIENYAPGTFWFTGAEDTNIDPSAGIVSGGSFKQGMGSGGAFSQGSHKQRTSHTAAPKLRNAFDIFFSHANQSIHWKHLAEISRELNGVFGNPELKIAMEARNPKAAESLRDYMRVIENNGVQLKAPGKFIQFLLEGQAYTAMAYKASTAIKNALGGALNHAYDIPPPEFIRGLGRLAAGKLEISPILNSEIIQNKLNGGNSPELRAAISKSLRAKPTLRGDLLLAGMEIHATADAYGNVVGAAIAYDFHLRQTKEQNPNMPEGQAVAIAWDMTEDAINRLSQPSEVIDRSLAELNSNWLGKLMFLYRSEQRQKSSLYITAMENVVTGKMTVEDFRVIFISHLVMAPIMKAVSATLSDAMDPSDDEWFDEKNWNPYDFLIAAATGPLSGIMLLGDVFSSFTGTNSPLANYIKAGKSAVDIFTDDPKGDKLEWYSSKINNVLHGVGAFPGVAANIVKQVVGTARNLAPD